MLTLLAWLASSLHVVTISCGFARRGKRCLGVVMPVWRFAHRLALGLLLAAWAIPARAELSETDRQIYREAFQAAHSGDWASAGRRTERAHDKLLAKVLWWANLSRGGSGAVFTDFAEFLSANPDWPGQTALRQHAEASM